MKRLMILAVAVGLGLLWLITGCGDDGGGPSNSKPVIQSLSAAMDTVDTSGSCTINCVASDADGDSLSYQWHAGLGVIAGSGPSVVWTAPDIAGACTVSVTVSDDRGGSASDGTCIEVYGGTLLITTGNGLIAVDLDGSSFIMSESSGSVEVLGTRIFVKYGGHSMREYNSATQVVGSISIPDTIPYPYIPVVLPDGGFAFLDNANDRIDFIDSQGNYLLFIEMPEVSPHNLQAVDGVIVGNTLIVSETGTRKVIEVDLSSHTASIFKDLTSVSVRSFTTSQKMVMPPSCAASTRDVSPV
jgi:hypothetical protein